MKRLLAAATMTAGVWLATPAGADPFFFSTGAPNGLLGALSQPADGSHLETETADDFFLGESTSIHQATVVGVIPSGVPLADIRNVEVEIYHVFPEDSADPPSGSVPSRVNSPADVEIVVGTRDAHMPTVSFRASLLAENFTVANTVVKGIHPKPDNATLGEGPASGQLVQVTIDFGIFPLELPPGHYFFRPEVQVNGGTFLFASAPKPIVAPGAPFDGDLQAWIRNSALNPDWLRIATDVTGGAPVNMTFSLAGETRRRPRPAGRCLGHELSRLARESGGLDAAASTAGFPNVSALVEAVRTFCNL